MKRLPPAAPAAGGRAPGLRIRRAGQERLPDHRHREPRGPEAAALVANRYVDKFMDYLFESVGGKNEEAVTYLKGRAEQLKKDAEDAERQLQDYMRQHNLVSLEKSVDIVSDRLKSVNNALTSARLEMLNVEQLVEQVAEFKKSGKDLLEISYIATHGAVPGLKAQLNDAEQTQALLMERYLEKHPKVIDNADKIAITKVQLAKAVDLAIADLNTRLAPPATTCRRSRRSTTRRRPRS
jgi:polysaccharide biosynthesis transport protein